MIDEQWKFPLERIDTVAVDSCLLGNSYLVTSSIIVKRKTGSVWAPAVNHLVQSPSERLLRVDHIALPQWSPTHAIYTPTLTIRP